MAKVLTSISFDAPASPVSASVSDTFAFTGTPGLTGSGGVQRYDWKWEVDSGGGYVTIASSATGLITADTNPVTNSNSQTANSITVTCDQAGSYTIRMAGAPATGGSYTVLSATETVTVSAPVVVTPGTVALTLSTFAPTVSVTQNQTVTPTTASLTLSTFAPTVTASDHKTVTPTTASLSLSTFAPTVTVATPNITVTPTTASLTLSTFAPTVSVSDNQTVTPGTASLTLSTFAPTISTTDNQIVVPGALSFVLTTFAPTVTISDHKIVTPETATLTLAMFAPTITAGGEITLATLEEVQAELDPQGVAKRIRLLKYFRVGTTDTWYVDGGVDAPGKAGWVTCMNTDNAATQAESITTATKALYP